MVKEKSKAAERESLHARAKRHAIYIIIEAIFGLSLGLGAFSLTELSIRDTHDLFTAVGFFGFSYFLILHECKRSPKKEKCKLRLFVPRFIRANSGIKSTLFRLKKHVITWKNRQIDKGLPRTVFHRGCFPLVSGLNAFSEAYASTHHSLHQEVFHRSEADLAKHQDT